MNRMAPRKSVKVDICGILFGSIGVTFVLWLIPLIRGKYAVIYYPFIASEDVFIEVIRSREHLAGPNVAGQNVDHLLPKLGSDNNNISRPKLPLCPIISPLLEGLNFETTKQELKYLSPNFPKRYALRNSIEPGGFWEPPECEARHAATVIVGYRNRTEQLTHLLLHLHPFLARQQLRYRIVVVEQTAADDYNRGKIFNIGFKEVMRLWPTAPESQCVIFHDVDLLPLHDHNMYACTHMPRHMSVAVDKFRYQLPYRELCGGAIALQSAQFKAINGFPNRFSGWGGEDDDFYNRINDHGLELMRFSPEVSVYEMMPHQPMAPSPFRYLRVQEHMSASDDGLHLINHTPDTTLHPLYTHVSAKW